MKAKLFLALFASAPLLTTCSIDFNEAVPCETDEHCPEGMGCDSELNRCVLGNGTPNGTGQDAGTDPATDTIPNDPVVTPDLAQDTAIETTPDIVETTPEVQEDIAADTGSDVCIPSTEVCNGQDDDCDGEPDNGLECGTCPDPDGMVLIVRPDTPVFCVDIYEASRPDATVADAGDVDNCADTGDVVNCVAHSVSGVKPWSLVDLETAEAACANAGKRLCTATEWTEACGGPSRNLYPYNASEYNQFTCNGEGTLGYANACGGFTSCVGPEGTYDMSGNLEEWVSDETTRGGAYDDSSLILRCTSDGESPATDATHATVGFRCCANAIAPD